MLRQLGLIAALLLLSISGVQQESLGQGADTPSTARIVFDNPTSIKKALTLATQLELKVFQLEHSVTDTTGQTWVGFVPVKSKWGIAKTKKKLLVGYAKALQIMLAQNSPQRSASLPLTTTPKLSAMSVRGDAATLARAMRTLEQSSNMRIETAANNDIIPLPVPQARVQGGWIPSAGTININEGFWLDGVYRPDRFVYSEFVWTDTSGFSTNSTYEHDFFLNGNPDSTDGSGIYLDPRETDRLTRMPVVYAISNLPSGYLDTRFGDPANQVAFTIGSADGDAIMSNKPYYTLIVTKQGTADRDTAILNAQLGYRSPEFCYLTWCSFSSEFQPLVVGTWPIVVPGSRTWIRNQPTPTPTVPSVTATPPQLTPVPGSNLLSNPGFESGRTPWGMFVYPSGSAGCAWTTDYGGAHSGSKMMSMHRPVGSGCLSIQQDIGVVPQPSETYTFAGYGRRGWDGAVREGAIALWALGGSEETNHTKFTLDGTWKCFQVKMSVSRTGHYAVRAEVYLDSQGHPDYQFDSFVLVRGDHNLCP